MLIAFLFAFQACQDTNNESSFISVNKIEGKWWLTDQLNQPLVTLLNIIKNWCKVHYDAVRKYDPDHLILDDKVGHRILDGAWCIMAEYYDLMYIQ